MMEKPVDQSECKAKLENGLQCDQNSTLDILAELNSIYQRKLENFDGSVGDGNERKISIYCAWVTDLLLQNAQLIRTIEELERVACNRLKLLENKLDATPKEYNNINGLQKTIKNLLKVIKRGREENVWDLNDMEFIGISADDISHMKNLMNMTKSGAKSISKESSDISLNTQGNLYDETNGLINELRHANLGVEFELAKCFEENKILKQTVVELNEKLAKEIEEKCSLEKMAADIPGLVVEVGEKYDTILEYRREISNMEEKLKLKDNTIHFKEQIIKGLRRECKKFSSSRSSEISSPSATSVPVISVKNQNKMKTKKKFFLSDDEADTESEINEFKFVDTIDKATDLSQNLLDVEIDELIKCKNRTIEEQKLMIEKLNNCLKKSDTKKLLHIFDIVLRSIHNEQFNSDFNIVIPADDFVYVANIFGEAINGLQLNYDKNANDYLEHCNFMDDSIIKIKSILMRFQNALIVLKTENTQLNQFINDYKAESKDGSSSGSKKSHSDEYLLIDELNSLSNISIFRQSMKEHVHDKLKAQKYVSGYMLLDLAEVFSKILGKQLSNDSLNEIKHGNIKPFNNLMTDLQQELQTKDCLLHSRNEKIVLLEDDLQTYKNELFELRRKLESISKERVCEQETIDNLKLALTAHVDTITQLQKTNDKLQKEKLKLQESLSEQHNACLNHMKKLDKFEQECERQLCTISNLRSALEKRVIGDNSNNSLGSSCTLSKTTKAHGADKNGAWCWWRNVHDV